MARQERSADKTTRQIVAALLVNRENLARALHRCLRRPSDGWDTPWPAQLVVCLPRLAKTRGRWIYLHTVAAAAASSRACRPRSEANLPAAVTRRNLAIPHAHAAAAASLPVLWPSPLGRRPRRRRVFFCLLDAPTAVLLRRGVSFVCCVFMPKRASQHSKLIAIAICICMYVV